jgi:hypothetical protein
MKSAPGNSWLEALPGALAFLAALLTPFLRARRRRWGATADEIAATHPGDELVPTPKWTADHAISIDATPQQVWPWIVQIGQGRGGFYSYVKLENLAGCQIENTDRILDEHQGLREGDPIRLHVDMPPMTAAIVEEGSALVLHGDQTEAGDSATVSTTWAFLLLEQPDGTTRLLSRTRYHHGDDLRSKLMGGPLLIEPVSFVMERKMLNVIKALVERHIQENGEC